MEMGVVDGNEGPDLGEGRVDDLAVPFHTDEVVHIEEAPELLLFGLRPDDGRLIAQLTPVESTGKKDE